VAETAAAGYIRTEYGGGRKMSSGGGMVNGRRYEPANARQHPAGAAFLQAGRKWSATVCRYCCQAGR